MNAESDSERQWNYSASLPSSLLLDDPYYFNALSLSFLRQTVSLSVCCFQLRLDILVASLSSSTYRLLWLLLVGLVHVMTRCLVFCWLARRSFIEKNLVKPGLLRRIILYCLLTVWRCWRCIVKTSKYAKVKDYWTKVRPKNATKNWLTWNATWWRSQDWVTWFLVQNRTIK